jgi:hypothetical protein
MTTRPPSEPQTSRLVPAGYVLVTLVVALGISLLLNAAMLERGARSQPPGWTRTLSLALIEPVAGLARFIGFDRPRTAIDSALGRAVATPPAPGGGVAASGSTTTSTPTRTTVTTEPGRTTATTARGGTAVRLRTPTEADPLKVWMMGDSMVETPGPQFLILSDSLGLVDADVYYEYISGLNRSDYFDWPAYFAEELPKLQPDALIVTFGANDGQDAFTEDGVVEAWSPEWFEWYRPRVEEAMDVLSENMDGIVYWVGLPVMENDTFTEHVRQLNELFAAEAEKHPNIEYVDIWELFQDESGNYNAYLPDPDGGVTNVRYPDGVHFTPQGGLILARHLMSRIAEDAGFEYQPED